MKHRKEDVLHYRDMLKAEEKWLASLRKLYPKASDSIKLMLETTAQQAKENIEYYREQLDKAIGRG